MGLAASQARFLAITSRKANCEFQSMEIAQQKLSVTRDMQTATNNYQSKINATKLIWDLDGQGKATSPMELTYNLMMTPSAANNYDPYLLTDKAGRVVLNGKMAAAAKKISPDGRTVTRSKAGRDEFLEALAGVGYISSSMAEKISKSNTNYIKGAGMGAPPLDKTTATAVTINTLSEILKDDMYKMEMGTFLMPLDDTGHQLFKEGENSDDLFKWDFTGENRAGSTLSITKDGKVLDKEAISKLTLGDLLSNQYVIMMAMPDNTSADKQTIPGINTVSPQNNQETLLFVIAQMLGRGSGGGKGIVSDPASAFAMEFAYKQMTLLLNAENSKSVGNPNSTSKSYKDVYNNTQSYNGYITTGSSDLNKKENAHVGLSLTNMMSSFLSYYASALDGFQPGYKIGKESEDSRYVTDDLSYYYIVKDETSNSVTEKDLLMTDFYNMLYNNICASGWTTNDYVDDPDYLANAIKNGQLFISSLSTDGRYYQGPYTENGYVVEVTDDDAIAEAEREYAITKSKLNYKEEKLELDMKTFDLEISSLTTEYDTVKNMLGKNVEKIFTMFGN